MCQLHFKEEDILRVDRVVLVDGNIFESKRSRPRLKPNSIPHLNQQLSNRAALHSASYLVDMEDVVAHSKDQIQVSANPSINEFSHHVQVPVPVTLHCASNFVDADEVVSQLYQIEFPASTVHGQQIVATASNDGADHLQRREQHAEDNSSDNFQLNFQYVSSGSTVFKEEQLFSVGLLFGRLTNDCYNFQANMPESINLDQFQSVCRICGEHGELLSLYEHNNENLTFADMIEKFASIQVKNSTA